MSANEISENINFLLFEKGEDILIDNIAMRALLLKSTGSSGYYITDKVMCCKEPITSGSVADLAQKKWLVISQVDKQGEVYKCILRECNYLLKLDVEDWAYPFNAVLEMGKLGFKGSSGFQIVDGNLYATIQSNELSRKVKINHRFIASDSAWKIVGVDKTLFGLITLFAEKDLIQQGDDMENEIPYSVPKWAIEVANIPESISVNGSIQLDVVLKKNGVLFEGEQFLYESSDNTIAIFDNSLLKGIAEGSCDIAVRWAKHPELSSSFNLLVEHSAPVVVTYKLFISNLDDTEKSENITKLIENKTKKFAMYKYENGVLADVNDTYAFTVNPNGATSANYTFTVINTFTASFTNHKQYTGGAIVLKATSDQTAGSIQVMFYLRGKV